MTRPLEIRYRGRRLRGLDSIREAIDAIPRQLRGKGLEAAAQYLLKKYKLYPRYKWIKRKTAYPEVDGFFSDAQRRFVFAAIADGRIQPGSPHRTQTAKNAWRIENKNGSQAIDSLAIVNDAPAAVFLYHPIYQARQLDLVGWKDINEMTEENEEEAIGAAQEYVFKNFGDAFDKSIK